MEVWSATVRFETKNKYEVARLVVHHALNTTHLERYICLVPVKLGTHLDTPLCGPVDIAYMSRYKASVRRQWCSATVWRVLNTHDVVGQIVKQFELKTHLLVYLDVALNEVHTGARVKSAWKHFLEELYGALRRGPGAEC